MWLEFPAGAENVSVERQSFGVEHTDAEGRKFTRVPNHFAPKLTALGFKLAKQPEGAPGDLPAPDPLRDGAISDLTRGNEQLKLDLQQAQTDMATLQARNTALTNDNIALKGRVTELEAKLAEHEDADEDKE